MASSRAGGVLALAVLAGVLAGCQSTVPPVAYTPSQLEYAAESDSLGIDAFLRLSPAEQQTRRRASERWQERARRAPDLLRELRALHTAVGLDPSAGGAWLRLIRLRRWFTDYQQAEDALAGLQAALPHTRGPRRELAARAAISAAWLRYERGEWRRGLAWVDSAAVNGAPENDVQLLRALHLTGLGRNRRAEDVAFRFAQMDHRSHWIYGVSFWRRGGAEPAHAVFTGRDSGLDLEAVSGAMYPQEPWAAECFRDYGMVEELVENWWLAEQKYEAAIKHVPDRERVDLRRVDHPPLGRASTEVLMPVWLAYDRHYVTGSLSAFTNLAHARYRAAGDPATREFWAGAAVDAAGTCVRLRVDEAWARRARGLILSDFRDQWPLARHDLQQALRTFDRRAIEDVPTLATLGNLYLHAERPQQARPLLERAVAAAPERPRIWSDLGLALVQIGEVDRALPALEMALELDPELAVAWYNRGLLRYHMEDLDGAVSDLERAHELAPGDRDIEGLLEQLRRRRAQQQRGS
ncbi:tetratricopeptide repeat protein [bacterium]|nr:tetratricopeptide repeat protein [bacterium]